MKRICAFALLLISAVPFKAQFTVYNSTSSPVADAFCYNVAVDASNRVWVSTKQSGVYLLNGASWTNINTGNSGLSANYVTGLSFENDSTTWFCTYQSNGGVCRKSGSAWTTFKPNNSPLPDYNLICMLVDNAGNKWFGTRSYGLMKYNGLSWTAINTQNSDLPGNEIYSMEIDNSGDIWIGTALDGICRISGSVFTVFNKDNSALPDNSVYALKCNPATGEIWAGTSSGVAKFLGNSSVAYTTLNSALASDYVRGFAFTNSGSVVWMATGYNGISKFSGSSWTTYNTSSSNLPLNAVWSITSRKTSASNSEVWATLWGGGVVKLDANAGESAGVTERDQQSGYLYPVPASQTVEILDPEKTKAECLTVYSTDGRFIQRIPVTNNRADISSLPQGMYFYGINAAEAKGKLVISR